MCGRYYRKSDKQKIAEAFQLGNIGDFVLPPADYNVAPTTMQPVIRLNRESEEREMVLMRWGLIPNFAKDIKQFGFSTFNARAETIKNKPMWQRNFARHRCLIPADGFYEWKKVDAKNKQPYAFALRDSSIFAFAGLWDAWKDPATAKWLQSFTILTTDPNELTEDVHDRMPVILHPRDYERWLYRGPEARPPFDLLRPYEAEAMISWEAHKDVGNTKNNSIKLLNSK